MNNVLRYLNLVLLLVAASAISIGDPAAARESDDVTLVGRISHVEGKLLRYIEEDKDWVLTVKDAPFGLNDALYSGDYAKAEFMMPNRTWLRTGENTQVQLIDLNPDATTVDVASGLARLYNKSDDVVIKVTTPFGYVVAPGGTVFDLYVGDVSLEVIAIDGDVDFVHYGTNARYQVREGESSIIADQREVASGNGSVDADWDDWNSERDELWATRLRRSQNSAGYLPEWIREESYYLEENGRWERIYYEGEYRDVWRPTRVERGWRPFTAGRWTVYYGDNCWVPDEPFGYVTHHYGSWIYVESEGAWFWLPPAARFVADTPRFFIGFGWHPGRVGWIHSGPAIGWVPLAWDEEYYGHRHWGPRTVVVRPSVVINIDIHRYRFLDEAVVIPSDHLYRGTRYSKFVERNVSRDVIINNYQPVTVINNTVINNYNVDKRRFAYNDAEVERKPHLTVVNRITANQQAIAGADRLSRERIEKDLTRLNVRSELPPARNEIAAPVLTPKLVEPDKISRPISALDLKKREIKPRERERQISVESTEQGRQRVQGRAERPATGREQGVRAPQSPTELRKDQAEAPQVKEPGRTEEKSRLRSPREQKEDLERGNHPAERLRQPETGGRPLPPQEQQLAPRQGDEVRGRRGPQSPAELKGGQAQEPQRLQESAPGEERPRLRSPREQKEDLERGNRPAERLRQPETGQRPLPPQEQGLTPPQTNEARQRRGPQKPVELKNGQAQEPQQLQESAPGEDKPRLRSPREGQQQAEETARQQKAEDLSRQQEQVRKQQEDQQRQQPKLQQQEDERRRGEQQARQRQEEQAKQQQQAAETARQQKAEELARQQRQHQKLQQQAPPQPENQQQVQPAEQKPPEKKKKKKQEEELPPPQQ